MIADESVLLCEDCGTVIIGVRDNVFVDLCKKCYKTHKEEHETEVKRRMLDYGYPGIVPPGIDLVKLKNERQEARIEQQCFDAKVYQEGQRQTILKLGRLAAGVQKHKFDRKLKRAQRDGSAFLWITCNPREDTVATPEACGKFIKDILMISKQNWVKAMYVGFEHSKTDRFHCHMVVDVAIDITRKQVMSRLTNAGCRLTKYGTRQIVHAQICGEESRMTKLCYLAKDGDYCKVVNNVRLDWRHKECERCLQRKIEREPGHCPGQEKENLDSVQDS